jgi:hypothetical protein
VHFHTAICRLQTVFSTENLHFIKKNAVSGTGAIQFVEKWRSCIVTGKNTVYFGSAERGNGDFSSLPADLSSRQRIRIRMDGFALRACNDVRDDLDCLKSFKPV